MAGTGAKKQDKELSFEAAMSRLEEIVRSLESGTAPLDESLTMFEEGVHLVSLCNSTLDKIKMIEKKSGGEYTERDFDEN